MHLLNKPWKNNKTKQILICMTSKTLKPPTDHTWLWNVNLSMKWFWKYCFYLTWWCICQFIVINCRANVINCAYWKIRVTDQTSISLFSPFCQNVGTPTPLVFITFSHTVSMHRYSVSISDCMSWWEGERERYRCKVRST